MCTGLCTGKHESENIKVIGIVEFLFTNGIVNSKPILQHKSNTKGLEKKVLEILNGLMG